MPDLDTLADSITSTLTLTSDQAESAGIVAAEPGSTYELTVTVRVTDATEGVTAEIVEARDAVETSAQDEPLDETVEAPPARPLPSRKGPESFGMTPSFAAEE